MSSNASSDNTKMSTSAAKTSKKSAAKTETAPVAAPVAAAPAAAPAKASKAKATKEVAAPAPVVATPTPAVVPDATPAAAVEEDVSATLLKSLSDLSEQLASLKTAFASASAAVKVIEKQAARVIKKADRKRRRKTEATGEAKPCVFTTPVRITDELCAFLGQPKGSQVSRSAVTKGVMAYAHSHNLMEKQTIKADAALRKLLTLGEGETLSILNLQKFLRRHYIKPTPAAN